MFVSVCGLLNTVTSKTPVPTVFSSAFKSIPASVTSGSPSRGKSSTIPEVAEVPPFRIVATSNVTFVRALSPLWVDRSSRTVAFIANGNGLEPNPAKNRYLRARTLSRNSVSTASTSPSWSTSIEFDGSNRCFRNSSPAMPLSRNRLNQFWFTTAKARSCTSSTSNIQSPFKSPSSSTHSILFCSLRRGRPALEGDSVSGDGA